MPTPNLDTFSGIPTDEDGPVFKAPWEAQAFALVVRLQEQGVFSWEEWAEAMSQSINKAREQGDPDLGNTYYQHWLATLERMSLEKGLATEETLAEKKQAAHLEHQKLHSGHDHTHEH